MWHQVRTRPSQTQNNRRNCYSKKVDHSVERRFVPSVKLWLQLSSMRRSSSYDHPDNARAYNLKQTKKQQYYGPLVYKCFPTLEEFAALMRGNSTHCNYPYKYNSIVTTDCAALACAAIHGKVRFSSHLYFNYRNIAETVRSKTSRTDKMKTRWLDVGSLQKSVTW